MKTPPRPLILVLIAIPALVALGLLLVSEDSEPRSASVDQAVRNTIERTETGASDLVDVDAKESDEGRFAAAPAAELSRGPGLSAITAPEPLGPVQPYSGRILDSLGRPLGGVELRLQPWDEASEIAGPMVRIGQPRRKELNATTDDEGRFTMKRKKSVQLGHIVGLTATARGFQKKPLKHVFGDDAEGDMGDILLDPGVIVDGWVRDANGSPIPGARVRRIERDGDVMVDMLDQIGFSSVLGLVTCDDEGHFELPHEEPGEIILLAEHEDIMPARFDGPEKRPGDVLQDIVITAVRSGKIRGIISGYPKGRVGGLVAASALDPGDESEHKEGIAALMSAQMSPAGEHTAKIDGSGRFVVSGLTPGARYRVRALERRMFIETVYLSESVETAADGQEAVLRFEPGATVRFRVIDAETKKPIESLVVAAEWDDGDKAKVQLTAAGGDIPKRFPKGKATLHELRPTEDQEKLTVTVDAPGYLRGTSQAFSVAPSGVTEAGTLELKQAPRVRFLVIDAATLKPVKRARITMSTSGTPTDEENARNFLNRKIEPRQRGRTNKEGELELSALSADSVVLEVKTKGYADYYEAGFDPSAQDVKRIEISSGGAILAKVVDTAGQPAAAVRVECRFEDESGSKSTLGERTNARAEALFENLPTGTYEVRALRGNGMMFGGGRRMRRGRSGEVEEEPWTEIEVISGRRTEVELSVLTVGSIQGRITIDGDPAVGARISAVPIEDADRMERLIAMQDSFSAFQNSNDADRTGADGSFELPDIETGEYALLVRHPDAAMPTRKDVDVGDTAVTVNVEIVMTAVEGIIRDDEGEPIAGARISVHRHEPGEDEQGMSFARAFLGQSESLTETDASGRYVVRGVKSDVALEVRVQADGYSDGRSSPVTPSPNETRQIPDVELIRAGAVLASTPESEVGSVLFVRARPADSEEPASGDGFSRDEKIVIVRAGKARIDGLAPGKWTVTLTGAREGSLDNPKDPVVVDVKPGETVEVSFED